MMKSYKLLRLIFCTTALILGALLQASFAHKNGAKNNGVIKKVEPPVHQQITLQAINFLGGVPKEGILEIKQYLTRSLYAQLHKICEARYEAGKSYDIIGGSGDEDQAWNPIWCPFGTLQKAGIPHPPPYEKFPDDPDDIPNNGYFEHFWNPDKGIEDGGLDLSIYKNIYGVVLGDHYTSSYLKAQAIWDKKIIPSYSSEKKEEAYYWLGRVAHLLEDLTVPAHVHNDPHGFTLGDDSYEDFFINNPSRVFQYDDIKYKESGYNTEKLVNLDSSIWKDVYDGSAPPDLFKLFWYTAQRTQYFASDGNPFNESGFEGDKGCYTTLCDDTKFFTPNLWEGETIGRKGKVRKISLDKDIITDPDQLEKTFVGSNKNLNKVADVLIPHALKAVAGLYRLFWMETHPTLRMYDDFSAPQIDALRWDTLEQIHEIRGGKLISEIRVPQPVQENGLFLANPATARAIEADVALTEAEPPPSGASNTNGARVLLAMYNDGTPGGGFAGDVITDLHIGIQPGASTPDAFFQVFKCNDASCTSSSQFIFTSFGPVSVGVPHQVGINWDGSVVRVRLDSMTHIFDPRGFAPVVGPPISGYSGLTTVAASRVAAEFDNVMVNGGFYDDFSGPNIDPLRWRTFEFVREVQNGKLALRTRGIRFAGGIHGQSGSRLTPISFSALPLS